MTNRYDRLRLYEVAQGSAGHNPRRSPSTSSCELPPPLDDHPRLVHVFNIGTSQLSRAALAAPTTQESVHGESPTWQARTPLFRRYYP